LETDTSSSSNSVALDSSGSLWVMRPELQSSLLDNRTTKHPPERVLERPPAGFLSDAMAEDSLLNISRVLPPFPICVTGRQTKTSYTIKANILGDPGTFGEVHLATGESTGAGAAGPGETVSKDYAVKLQQHKLEDLDSEFRLCGAIEHPNVIQVYDFGKMTNSSFAWMAMEYIKGQDFYDYVVAKELSDEMKFRIVARQMVEGLFATHAKNIIHLDIKLANVMISDEEPPVAKIIDFGLARECDQDVCAIETTPGTEGFRAPELMQGNFSKKSDVFSLGVVFYTAICLQYPFGGESDVWDGTLRKCDTKWYPEFQDLIKKMLDKDPSKRASLQDVSWILSFPMNLEGTQTQTSYTVKAEELGYPGRFGRVHLAEARDLGPAGDASGGSKGTAVKLQQRKLDLLASEFRLCSTIEHPNVGRVYDFSKSPNGRWAWMAMEYIKGQELSQYVKKNQIDEAKFRPLAKQIVEGLLAIHAKNIIHSDVNLANIMISDADPTQAKIIDFGMALECEQEVCMDDEEESRGTEGYRAPEMLLGLISKKIDIFSLGVVFSWAVCDQSPFPEEGNAWNGALRLCTSSS